MYVLAKEFCNFKIFILFFHIYYKIIRPFHSGPNNSENDKKKVKQGECCGKIYQQLIE